MIQPRKINLKNGSTVTIRPLRLRDIASLHRAYALRLRRGRRFFKPPLFDREKRLAFLLHNLLLCVSVTPLLNRLMEVFLKKGMYIALIATLNNDIVGYAVLSYKTHAFHTRRVLELGIFVIDDLQGLGLGSQLMLALIELARKKKADAVILSVRADNIRAIKLYKKFGFKKLASKKSASKREIVEYILQLRIRKDGKDHEDMHHHPNI